MWGRLAPRTAGLAGNHQASPFFQTFSSASTPMETTRSEPKGVLGSVLQAAVSPPKCVFSFLVIVWDS